MRLHRNVSFIVTAGLVASFAGCSPQSSLQPPDSVSNSMLSRPAATNHAPSSESVLFAFPSMADGQAPNAPFVMTSAGDIFGTTQEGGAGNGGVAYELTPGGSGYTEQVIYNFEVKGERQPGPVVRDQYGNLFGIVNKGVFELYRAASTWKLRMAYLVPGGCAFEEANGELVIHKGVIYGACDQTVFSLTHQASGSYTEKTLYTFKNGADGSGPMVTIAIDSTGTLYGTTEFGGDSSADGTAFKLAPGGSGYTKTTLFDFGSPAGEGKNPEAGPAIDTAGNLYGTTNNGASGTFGAQYKLTPGSPQYSVSVLNAATQPFASGTPIVTSNGTVYSIVSGYDGGGGTLLEFTPGQSGYTMSVLYSFSGGNAGYSPRGDLSTDSTGALYGAAEGGAEGNGFLYKVQP